MRQMFGRDIRAIVADPEWQEVRRALVGRWKTGHDRCLSTLYSYLHKRHADPWVIARLYNYVTGSGFRTGRIKSDDLADFKRMIAWWYARHTDVLRGQATLSGIKLQGYRIGYALWPTRFQLPPFTKPKEKPKRKAK